MAVPAPAKAPAAAWQWSLAGLELKDGAAHFIDQTVSAAVPLEVDKLAVHLGGIDSAANAPVDVRLAGEVNAKGRLDIGGKIDVLAPAGELALKFDAVDLVPLQGWLPQSLQLLLTRGNLDADGQLQFGGAPLAVHYQGKAALRAVNVLDRSTDRSLLAWKTLELNGLDVQSLPLQLKLEDLLLDRFFVRLLVTPEGELQLDRLLHGGAPADATAKPAAQTTQTVPAAKPAEPARTTAAAAAGAPRPELPVQIGRIRFNAGTVVFNDQFIKPNYTANLSQLGGEIGPLASGKRGKVQLAGKVEKTAPLAISGVLDAFGPALFLDIRAQARGIDMSGFSPYSGRYLGYRIQKGKLSVDVNYHVENGQLQAGNRIFLDQLTLGEPVDSPSALSIPIKLALALLKNSRGEIDIDLPISGSLNDPQFSIGGIVFKAILNLLAKAVTAPFALLGSLFGGGESLSFVDFPAGQSVLTPEMAKRLENLARALADRPALTLEVTGMADPAVDGEAYRRVLLERQVRARKLAADAGRGKSTAAEPARLSSEDYEKYLTQLYKEARFEKPKNLIGLTKSLPVSEMEQLLVAHMALDDQAFRDLAARRAATVQAWLVDAGKVAGERVFVLEPEIAKAGQGEPGNRVRFSLR